MEWSQKEPLLSQEAPIGPEKRFVYLAGKKNRSYVDYYSNLGEADSLLDTKVRTMIKKTGLRGTGIAVIAFSLHCTSYQRNLRPSRNSGSIECSHLLIPTAMGKWN